MTASLTDPRFLAAVDLVRRTGAVDFQIRYQDDDTPTVWLAIAGYTENADAGLPGAKVSRWETDCATDPGQAVLRLAERLLDGGVCVHCGKASTLNPELDWTATFAEQAICWRAWDPELETFRRACE